MSLLLANERVTTPEEDLRCDSPAGIWETGASKKGGLEPMRRKEARLFIEAVTVNEYLHRSKYDEVAELHDTHGHLLAQVLQPTGIPIRESPTLKLKEEVAEYIAVEVDRKVEALRQASLLVNTQGQEGHERKHGEALPNFQTQGHAGSNLQPQGLAPTHSEALSKSLNERVAAYHAAVLDEARRDTNSSTFSYGREEDVPVVQPATSRPSRGWSFVGFPGYQEHIRGRWQQEEEQARAQAEQTQFQNSLRASVVAGVVAGIGEAQTHRTESNRSAVTLTLSRLTAEITTLLGDIPLKGDGIDTDSLNWYTYLKAYIMAEGKMSALPDDPHSGQRLQDVLATILKHPEKELTDIPDVETLISEGPTGVDRLLFMAAWPSLRVSEVVTEPIQ